MGGATMLISLNAHAKFRAAFIDSMACDVYRVIEDNMNQRINGFGSAVMSMACVVSGLRSYSNGCPPFPINPPTEASKLGKDKAVYFYHATNDRVCPFGTLKSCVANAEASGARVSQYYNHSLPIEEQNVDENMTKCDGHCDMSIINLPDFEERIIGFFNKELLQSRK